MHLESIEVNGFPIDKFTIMNQTIPNLAGILIPINQAPREFDFTSLQLILDFQLWSGYGWYREMPLHGLVSGR